MKATWDINGIRARILAAIRGDLTPVMDGRVETMLEVISAGDQGTHQPSDVFTRLNLDVPDYHIGEPETYNPDDDPWIWETIEDVASKESEELREELDKDEAFLQQVEEQADWWYVVFGHRDSDDAYGLIFGYLPEE